MNAPVRVIMVRPTTGPGGADALPGDVLEVDKATAETWLSGNRAQLAPDVETIDPDAVVTEPTGDADPDAVVTVNGDPTLTTAPTPATRRRNA